MTLSSTGRGFALFVHHVVKGVELSDRLQPAVGSQHVHPFGKEQVDLGIVFLERGEAGCVPLHVERAANAFIGIQHHLRGRPLGFAVGILGACRLTLLVVLEGVIRLLDSGKARARELTIRG